MKNNNISYIIPAFNCEKTILEAVNSIYKKNFIDGDELIIVNDGSTDNTKKILEKIKKTHDSVKIFTHLKNKGGGSARNTAVNNSKNNLIFLFRF